MIAADGFVPVPLRFVPLTPGHYPCKILLTSRYDVRVYHVEGVVDEEHPEARFEFETAAFEALTQNIPIVRPNFFCFLHSHCHCFKVLQTSHLELLPISNCLICCHWFLHINVRVLFLNIRYRVTHLINHLSGCLSLNN